MIASRSTSPASSLYDYYQRGKVVKTFIVVTDEEENTGYDRSSSWYHQNKEAFFAKLYKDYSDKIYPAKLIFISFTKPNSDGFMVKDLKERLGESRFAEYVDVYKFDIRNPDLNRLDLVLEKMSVNIERNSQKNIDDAYILEYVLERCNLSKEDVIKDMSN